jgi:hypothetical protein
MITLHNIPLYQVVLNINKFHNQEVDNSDKDK